MIGVMHTARINAIEFIGFSTFAIVTKTGIERNDSFVTAVRPAKGNSSGDIVNLEVVYRDHDANIWNSVDQVSN